MTEYGTRTVGIDLGDRTSVACIYMPRVVVGWFDFPMTPEEVREAFEGKAFAKVAIEAGAQSGWVTRAFGRCRRAELPPRAGSGPVHPREGRFFAAAGVAERAREGLGWRRASTGERFSLHVRFGTSPATGARRQCRSRRTPSATGA